MLNRRGITTAALVGMAAQLTFMLPVGAASNLDGWRFPDERDVTGNWRRFRQPDSEFYTTAADFDGDGTRDEAWILIKNDDSQWGLFVFLNADSADRQVIELERTDMAKAPPQNIGIELAKPGSYATPCAKGYYPCAPGEPRTITLRRPAINYLVFEKANAFFFWDEARVRFERIWISD